MNLRKRSRKVLALVLAGAMLLMGVDIGMVKAEAEDVTLLYQGEAVVDFKGIGSYTVTNDAALEGGNLGSFESNVMFSITDACLEVNDKYSFTLEDKVCYERVGSDGAATGIYVIDYLNTWQILDASRDGEELMTSEGQEASIVYRNDESGSYENNWGSGWFELYVDGSIMEVT